MEGEFTFETDPKPLSRSAMANKSPNDVTSFTSTYIDEDGVMRPAFYVRGDTIFLAGDAQHIDRPDYTALETIEGVADSGRILEQPNASQRPRLQKKVHRQLSAVRFDGSDNTMRLQDSGSMNLEHPFHMFVVFRFHDLPWKSTTEERLIGDGNNYFGVQSFNTGAGNLNEVRWMMDSNSSIDGGVADTDLHVASIVFNENNSQIRIDGTQVVAGDVGTRTLQDFQLCPNSNAKVDILRWMLFDDTMQQSVRQIEQYLDNYTDLLA